MFFIVLDDDVGYDIVVFVSSDLQAGSWVKGGNSFDGLLDFFDGSAGLFGDGGESVHLEVFEMLSDDFQFEGAVAVEVIELDDEAFGEVPGTDAGRFEGLDKLQGLLHLLGGNGFFDIFGEGV